MTIDTVEDLQRLAAHHAFMLVRPSETLIDCLDLLAELGGRATVKQMRDHLGHGGWTWHSKRLRALVEAGLIERKRQHGNGALYALTAAGVVLQVRA